MPKFAAGEIRGDWTEALQGSLSDSIYWISIFVGYQKITFLEGKWFFFRHSMIANGDSPLKSSFEKLQWITEMHSKSLFCYRPARDFLLEDLFLVFLEKDFSQKEAVCSSLWMLQTKFRSPIWADLSKQSRLLWIIEWSFTVLVIEHLRK